MAPGLGAARTRAERVPVLVQEAVAGVEHVAGVVAHGEVEGGDARVVAEALVRPQLLPQLLAKGAVCGLRRRSTRVRRDAAVPNIPEGLKQLCVCNIGPTRWGLPASE